MTIALAVYLGLLVWRLGAVAGGADSSGYLNHARLLAERRPLPELRILPGLPPAALSPLAYVPLGFSGAADHTMTPVYPLGLPALLVVAAQGVGWAAAAPTVMALHALAGLLVVYLLGRQSGLAPALALAGAALLAVSPLYVFMSLQLMSDVPSLAWVTGAVCLANAAARRPVLAVASGLAFSIAVLIRPTNILAVPALAVALGPRWRLWSAFLAGTVPGAIVAATYNAGTYGSPLVSGYGNPAELLSWRHAGPTVLHYVAWLPLALSPVVVLAAALPLRIAENRVRGTLAVWLLAYGGFYACYSFTHTTWWYLRFLLPALPALLVAALLATQAAIPRISVSARRRWLTAATGAMVIAAVAANAWLHTTRVGRDERNYIAATAWARAHLPADTVVFAMQTSGALYHETRFVVLRWDNLHGRDFATVEQRADELGRPVVAMLFAFEEKAFFGAAGAGGWSKLGQIGHVDIWQRSRPGGVPGGVGR